MQPNPHPYAPSPLDGLKRFVWSTLAVMLVAGSSAGAATEALHVRHMMPATNLAPHLSVMVDSTARIGIDQVLAGETPPFVPNTRRIPSFGFTRDAIWLKCEIRNDSGEDQQLTAILRTARLDHFAWHVVDDGRLLQSRNAGVADEGRPVFYRFPRIDIDIPAGETRTLYARSQSGTSQWFELVIGCEQAINRNIVVGAMSDLALVGFIFAVVVFSLLFCVLQRQRFYLYLGSFALSYLVYYGIFNGYLRLLFPELPLWIERELFGMFCGLSVFVFTRFNALILGLDRAPPGLRVCQWLADGFAFVSIAMFVLVDFALAIQCFALMQALAYLCGSVVVLWCPTRREVHRVPLLITWLSWGGFVILLNLQFADVVPVFIRLGLIQQMFVPVILGGFFISIAYHQRSLDGLRLDLAQSQRAETSARLSALRYQINPHFLFNTLTSIDALSRSAPGRIPELVGKLATFLRLRLLESQDGLSTLRQEVESLRAYLDIEQLRYGEALKAHFQIAPESLDVMVPELILQPLVENAVKYGFEKDCDLEIRIQSSVAYGSVRIDVSNPGSLQASNHPDTGLGIGIENIVSRLHLHYGDRAWFTISQQEDRVISSMGIPQSKIA